LLEPAGLQETRDPPANLFDRHEGISAVFPKM
jgi:hypothetical protein